MNQEKIGKLIAKLRKSKGLTQSELGDMVGVGFRAVSKWENGITVPDISIIKDLSNILGISADELLKGELNKSSQTKSNFNIKKLLYLIPIILIIILVLTIITINKNKTEVYKLSPVDSTEYYIDGEVIFNGNDMTINITKLSFENDKFSNTVINNYQYELYTGNILIVGYGFTPVESSLSSLTRIKEWCHSFKINYNEKPVIKPKKIINNIMSLKFVFIDSNGNEISKKIEIELLKETNH